MASLSTWPAATLAAASIFVSGMCGGGAIIFTSRLLHLGAVTQERILGIASSFGGGVFLAAGYCHLLADAIEQLSSVDYPIAELCSAIGLMLTFLIELAGDSLLATRARVDHQCRRTVSASTISNNGASASASAVLSSLPTPPTLERGSSQQLVRLQDPNHVAQSVDIQWP